LIVRGAVPLALFGAAGYGAVLGVIATPILVVNAVSPTLFAMIVDRWGWHNAQIVLVAVAAASCLAMEVMSRWYERGARAPRTLNARNRPRSCCCQTSTPTRSPRAACSGATAARRARRRRPGSATILSVFHSALRRADRVVGDERHRAHVRCDREHQSPTWRGASESAAIPRPARRPAAPPRAHG
jgi:hypothetical protein